MMRLVFALFTLISMASSATAFAQFSYPALPQAGAALDAFVPAGWKVALREAGDLNKDGLDDVVAVLESKTRVEHARSCGRNDHTSLAAPRILIVLLAQPQGRFRLGVREDNLVLRADEGGVFGDPLEDLRIERGAFILRHYGGSAWRWSQDFRFRLQNGGWFLIGYTDTSHHNISRYMREYDYNPLTGKVKITTVGEKGQTGCRRCFVGETCPTSSRCDKDEVPAPKKESWASLGKRPLISLAQAHCALEQTQILPFVPSR